MNKRKLILLSDKTFLESYIHDSVIPSKIKNFDVITNEKNPKLSKLLKNYNCKIYVVKKISNYFFKKNFDIKNSLLISAGSTWLIKSDIIKLFNKNILNIHQSPLPSLRGAVASYAKLFEIRAFQTCIHVINEQIDKGSVVVQKDIFIDKKYDTPLKINNYLQKNNRELLKDFLISYFIKKKKVSYLKQNEFFSSYMPRLKTDLNGWIDWSQNVYELERFIGAFDQPYAGAKTYLHGKQVSLMDVQLSCMEPSRHFFENGMVIRKFMDNIVISTIGGTLYVKKVIQKNENIIQKIIPGDIFYTKIKNLDFSKRKNIYIKKDKNIFKHKNLNIKKI